MRLTGAAGGFRWWRSSEWNEDQCLGFGRGHLFPGEGTRSMEAFREKEDDSCSRNTESGKPE